MLSMPVMKNLTVLALLLVFLIPRPRFCDCKIFKFKIYFLIVLLHLNRVTVKKKMSLKCFIIRIDDLHSSKCWHCKLISNSYAHYCSASLPECKTLYLQVLSLKLTLPTPLNTGVLSTWQIQIQAPPKRRNFEQDAFTKVWYLCKPRSVG